MIKLRYVLQLKLKLREYRTRFDSKHLHFLYYYCLSGQPVLAYTRIDQQMPFPPPLPPSGEMNKLIV